MRLRPGREPLRRGEAALREADPDQRPRAPRPRALHPLRPLHPVRQGGGRRPADPLPSTGATRPRSTPSPTTRSRRTSAATPCRSARSGALTAEPYRFKARPWDLDEVESTCTDVLGRLPHRASQSSPQPACCATIGVDIDPVNWGWLCDKGRFGFEADQQPRTASASRWCAHGDDARAELAGPTPSRAAAGAISAARRPPAARRGIARASAAPASPTRPPTPGPSWPRASSAPTTSTPSSATACPAEVVLGLPRATIDEACAAGGTVVLLGPDLKEELPVLFLRLRARRRRATACTLIELAPARHRRSTELAAASLRYRPGEAGAVVGAARRRADAPAGVDADASAAARDLLAAGDRHRRCSAGPRWPRPPAPSSTPPPRCSRPAPRPRSCRALRRANVHGALDMGLAPGLLPGRVTLDDGRRLVRRRLARRARRAPASTPPASSPPRPRAASRCWCCSAPTRWPTSPTATWPRRALGRRPHGHRRRPVPHRRRSGQADVVLPAAGFAEVDGTHHQHRGPGQPRSARRSRRRAPPAPTG